MGPSARPSLKPCLPQTMDSKSVFDTCFGIFSCLFPRKAELCLDTGYWSLF